MGNRSRGTEADQRDSAPWKSEDPSTKWDSCLHSPGNMGHLLLAFLGLADGPLWEFGYHLVRSLPC